MSKRMMWIVAVTVILGVTPWLLRAQSTPAAPKWQYQIVRTNGSITGAQASLDKLAADGWELVCGNENVIYFRKPAPAPSTAQ